MRLAILDTNVVVSAGIQPLGYSARIVDSALDGQLKLVTCPTIVVEYREVLHRPRLAKHGFPPEWFDFLVDQSLQLSDPPPWPLHGPDPDDLIFLALAQVYGAVLVTGNLADYPDAIRGGVVVFSPKEYWESLRLT